MADKDRIGVWVLIHEHSGIQECHVFSSEAKVMKKAVAIIEERRNDYNIDPSIPSIDLISCWDEVAKKENEEINIYYAYIL